MLLPRAVTILTRVTTLSTLAARTSSMTTIHSVSVSADGNGGAEADFDELYPGTAVRRMKGIRARARAANLTGPWPMVRREILRAGGLKDLPNARPGQGYTGHSFNDWNHCDLTAMAGAVSHNENNGLVQGIAQGNLLGPGISIASLQDEDLGPGGSWSTCIMGCNREPPADVAHLQFRSRIAFKLVWCPPSFTSFVLVDDDGAQLNAGTPAGGGDLPSLRERKMNYEAVEGSKYATAAVAFGASAGKL